MSTAKRDGEMDDFLAALWVLGVALLAGGTGCQQQQASPPPPGFAFDRGERFLAAGSPKSAIPFLTQTVTSTPDGPEPMALLSLAYALDLQPERAILQARKVRRPPGNHGWEFVAVGIAKMTQHLPDEAVSLLHPPPPKTRCTIPWHSPPASGSSSPNCLITKPTAPC